MTSDHFLLGYYIGKITNNTSECDGECRITRAIKSELKQIKYKVEEKKHVKEQTKTSKTWLG